MTLACSTRCAANATAAQIQSAGAHPSLAGFCVACGWTLPRTWVQRLASGAKASETLRDDGFFKLHGVTVVARGTVS